MKGNLEQVAWNERGNAVRLVSVLGLFLLIGIQGFAQGTWEVVRELPAGTELKIHRQGVAKPLQASLEEATTDALRVVVKNEQISIDREAVLRVEARLKSRRTATRKETITSADGKGPVPGSEIPGPMRPGRGPSGSSETKVTLGTKGKFETVYARPKG